MTYFAPHRGLALLPSLLVLSAWGAAARADITSQGDISPALPIAGGSVSNPIIGNTSFGTATINGGTSLTGTTGSLGDKSTGLGDLTITGFGSIWDLSSTLTVGNSGAGRIQVNQGGRLQNNQLIVGNNSGAAGWVSIDGFGTVWESGSTTRIGLGGDGAVDISAGARYYSTSGIIGQSLTGNGSVTVQGLQSLWRNTSTLLVGSAGTARMEILDGADVENTVGTICNSATARGTVLVSGLGSTWTNTTLALGVDGISALEVAAGGRVTNSSTTTVKIADAATAEAAVRISGADSLWTSSADVTVASAGVAALEILDGGRIESTDVIIADLADSHGTVVVDGQNSMWKITGQLDVGDQGFAEMTVSNSGVVSVSSTSTSAFAVGKFGQLTMAGGRLIGLSNAARLENNGILRGSGVLDVSVTSTANAEIRTTTGDRLEMTDDLVNSGLIDMRGGTLEVSTSIANTGQIALQDGAALRVTRFDAANNPLANNSGGQLAATGGTVDVYATVTNAAGGEIVVGGGSTAIFHDNVTNNGDLFVMPGSRALLLEDLTFGASSTTTLVLASTAGDVGGPHVDVAGSATLAGDLSLLLADGYSPTAGDSFQLLTAVGGIAGGFANTTLPALASGLAWNIDQQAQTLLARVVADDPGDFNGDGLVNGEDLAAWEAGFGLGPGATAAQGDADGNGFVNGADFLAWQRGYAPATVSVAAAVPEPSGLAAALILGVAGALVRRRR